MKVLVLGGNGFVGKNVTEALAKGQHEIIQLSRRNGLDLSSFDNTKSMLKDIKPQVIVNCAALVGSLNYVTQIAADILILTCASY